VDRKVLADMAVRDAAGFAQLAEKAKAFAPKPKPAASKAPSASLVLGVLTRCGSPSKLHSGQAGLPLIELWYG
jgi:hypothetical protein